MAAGVGPSGRPLDRAREQRRGTRKTRGGGRPRRARGSTGSVRGARPQAVINILFGCGSAALGFCGARWELRYGRNVQNRAASERMPPSPQRPHGRRGKADRAQRATLPGRPAHRIHADGPRDDRVGHEVTAVPRPDGSTTAGRSPQRRLGLDRRPPSPPRAGVMGVSPPPISPAETPGCRRREWSRTRGRSARRAGGGDRDPSRPAAIPSHDAPGVVRPGPGMDRNVLREEPDREVTEEPDGPRSPTVEGPERMRILRTTHHVEGRCGAGEPTPVRDLVGGRVDVASRSWRCFPVVGAMARGHRPNGF